MATGGSIGRTFRPPSYLLARPMPVRQPSGGGPSGQTHGSPVHPRLQRTTSTSSVMSTGSGFSAPGSPSWTEHSDDEAQFLMSGTNTPRTEHPPPYGHNRSRFGSSFGASRPHSRMGDDDDGTVPHYKERLQAPSNRHLHRPQQLVSEPTTASHSTTSHPIAIEPPSARRFLSAPVYTPLEPLSARGDLPGGYFPNHENPATRIHRTHPFHTDTHAESFSLKNMHGQLVQKQPTTSLSHSMNPTSLTAKAKPADAVGTGGETGSTARNSTNASLMSYLPSGAHDVPLPMGKYYPSNYEQRSGGRLNNATTVPAVSGNPASSENTTRPKNAFLLKPPATTLPSGSRSDSVVPNHQGVGLGATDPPQQCMQLVLPSRLPSPSRSTTIQPQGETQRGNDSDAKHRLRQYQRDMIAQARLAANGLLQKPGGSSGIAPATLRSLPIKHLSLDGNLPILGGKPVSPRLAPLGSPIGPVTPMELEDGGGSYLSKGRAEVLEILKLPDATVAKVESQDITLATAEREPRLKRQERRETAGDASGNP